MQLAELTSSDLESRAARLRRQITDDFQALSDNLKPGNLYQEAVRVVGIDKTSMSGAVALASRRHPVPTLLVAIALGLFTYSVVKKRSIPTQIEGLKASMAETATTLASSATGVFQQQAEEKKREFVGLAQAQIAFAAAKLSDAIEKKLGHAAEVIPGGGDVRPLLVSGIQVLLTAALDGFLRPRSR